MALTITVGVNSFLMLSEAEDYFLGRLNSEDYWSTSLTENTKLKALVTAYNQLINCGEFTFPATVDNAMKFAQCEQALFLLQQGNDIDSRKALQAQGVIEAGIVKEKYSGELSGMPICVNARNFLKDYIVVDPVLSVTDIKRDEELEADESVEEDNQ